MVEETEADGVAAVVAVAAAAAAPVMEEAGTEVAVVVAAGMAAAAETCSGLRPSRPLPRRRRRARKAKRFGTKFGTLQVWERHRRYR